LHQFLIQWVGEEVKIVHADASAHIALANASADWRYGNVECISGHDLSEYDFLSVKKLGFVPISVQPAVLIVDAMGSPKNMEWLQHRIEQYQSKANDMSKAIEDFDDMDKLGLEFSSADPLEEVDIGDGTRPRSKFVNKKLSLSSKMS
jgi:hypothetical protein